MGNQEEQSVVKKSAYAALGLPSQIANKLREGMSNISEASADTREKLMAQLEQSMDEWKAEGERVTKSVIGKVKDSTEAATGKAMEVMETAKDKVKTGSETTESAAATVAKPAVPIEAIDGVGLETMKTLNRFGVGTVKGLAGQDPAALREKMASDAKFKGSVPSENTLSGWIDSAKTL